MRRIIAFAIGFTLMWGILGTQYVFGMGNTQFGTYSQEYLDRQKCKADAKAAGTPEDACKRVKHRRH